MSAGSGKILSVANDRSASDLDKFEGLGRLLTEMLQRRAEIVDECSIELSADLEILKSRLRHQGNRAQMRDIRTGSLYKSTTEMNLLQAVLDVFDRWMSSPCLTLEDIQVDISMIEKKVSDEASS